MKKPTVGDTVEHAGKQRRVTAVQQYGQITRVWVEFDYHTERSGYEGYYEIRPWDAMTLEERYAELEAFVMDIRDHGLRCDMTPTMMWNHDRTFREGEAKKYSELTAYFGDAAKRLRDRARRLLEGNTATADATLTVDQLREYVVKTYTAPESDNEADLPLTMQPGWDPEAPGREMEARNDG